MKLRLTSLAAAAALVMGMSSTAQAQLVATGLDCDHNGAMAAMGAVQCTGAFVGNINNQQADVLSMLNSSFGANTYTLLGYSNDVNNGPFSNSPSSNAGTLNFDGSISGSFLLGLKAGNAFSFYKFTGTNITSVDFVTYGVQVNGNDIGAGLSHASLYSDGSTTITTTSVVPEPSTYALMFAGLFAVGVAARRRRNA